MMWGLLLLLLAGLALVLLIGAAMIVRAIARPPRKTYAHALAKGDPTDPSELGRAAEAVTFRLPDETTTPGWIIAGDAPDGPTVVILHGFGDSRFGAMTRIAMLGPHASRLVVFDLRGQGESTATYCRGGETEVADAIAILNQLGDRRVVLLGYSMGGQIAMAVAGRLAQRGDERVIGVIADGPYRRWQTPIVGTLRCKGLPAFPLVPLARAMIVLGMGRAVLFDRGVDAGAMRCPMLILHGEADPVCPIEEARSLAEASPAATLVTFEEGTHLDLDACDPARYQDAVGTFFTRVAREHASPKSM